MKANRNFLGRDDAEVGVGTLIVFIAMVLVAAVAASVLIATSGTLQQRASLTGQEATEEVSSNLKVIGVYGERNTTTVDLYNVTINAELAAGAVPLDMQQLVIRFSDGTQTTIYSYSSAALSSTSGNVFVTDWIRGSGANSVMQAGDLIEIKFNLVDSELAEREDIAMMLIPEQGSPVNVDFRTPSTYQDHKTIVLRT